MLRLGQAILMVDIPNSILLRNVIQSLVDGERGTPGLERYMIHSLN